MAPLGQILIQYFTMTIIDPILAASLNINLNITAIIALVAGILILIRPKLLSMIVAIYLIVVGVVGLLGI